MIILDYSTDFVRVIIQMVFRFSLIPGILGSHDGPNDLCSAPDIDATSPFHRSLLRIDWAYFIFQSWSQYPSNFPKHVATHLTNSTSRVAWKHTSYLGRMSLPISLPDLVLG